jgi:DNA ligase-1
MFEESYAAVGDLAETIALLLPPATRASDRPLHVWIEQVVLGVAGESDEAQRRTVVGTWEELDGVERFLFNKLITGGFRVGVSQALVIRALSKASGIDEATVAHRVSGTWEPTRESFERLVGADTKDADVSRPYPFFLAYALDEQPETLGDAPDWQVEWKWDGIRAQLIRRAGHTFLWSRGEEPVADRFPEIGEAARLLPEGTVLDGEVMPWRDGEPLPFAQLQRRIGRKVLGPKILSEVPVVLVVYDLLEIDGADVRSQPMEWRRERLTRLLAETRGAASRARATKHSGGPSSARGRSSTASSASCSTS